MARRRSAEEATAPELARGDAVTANGKSGNVTGFTRNKNGVYVRFEKGAGLFPRSEVERETKRR